MKKGWFTLISLLVLVTMLLSACGTPATPTAAPTAEPTEEVTAEPVETETAEAVEPTEEAGPTGKVLLWHSWKENEIESLNDVIAAFNAQYPDITVETLYVPFDDLRGKFETASATGGGPSVLIGAADWGPALYNAGLVSDISGDASDELLNTINPAALGAVQYNEALIGLPETIKGVVMFRNKAIVADAPASYEDLVAASEAATDKTKEILGANLERGFFFSAAQLTACGGSLMEANGDPAFNNEAGVCWLNLLKSFEDAGPAEYYSDNDVNSFKGGKAGIIIDGSWNMSSLAEAIGADNLAIDPWPTYGDSHLSGYVQTENIYLGTNASDEDKAASWSFIEFFLGNEAQTLLADPKKAAHIPAIDGVEISDPLMAQAAEAFKGGTVYPVIPEMGAYWEAMDNALKSVFEGNATPEDALKTAEESIAAKIKEIRGQ